MCRDRYILHPFRKRPVPYACAQDPVLRIRLKLCRPMAHIWDNQDTTNVSGFYSDDNNYARHRKNHLRL